MTDPGKPEPDTLSGVDTKLVETLAEIAHKHDLSEVEVEQGSLKIRVVRQRTISADAPPPRAATFVVQPAAVPVAEDAVRLPNIETAGAVKSPMVGTAYLRSSPSAPAFVEIGSEVKAGDKILLIEAMKTFNEISAPHSGIVTAILIEDGQPVEYGQPLLVIT